MKKCPFCLKKINRIHHIYRCIKNKEGSNLTAKKKYLVLNYPEIATKAKLIEHYEKGLKSFPDLKREFNINSTDVTFLLNIYKIHKRSISESSKLISSEKYKKTCLKRYGTTNSLSKGSPGYKKKNKTVESKYGVENVFQIEAVKDKINCSILEKYGKKRVTNGELISQKMKEWTEDKRADVSSKISESHLNRSAEEIKSSSSQRKETLKTKYNTDIDYNLLPWPNLVCRVNGKRIWQEKTEEDRVEILKRLHNVDVSGIEDRVNSVLHNWSLSYTHSFYYDKYQFDFKVGKMLVEVNGDFYHANPSIYQAEDIVMIPNTNGIKAGTIWSKDLRKKKAAMRGGFEVVYLWETEIKNCDGVALEKLMYERIFNYENQNNPKN